MPIGRITRSIAGFLSVESLTDPGRPLLCSIRGRLKNNPEGFVVGDKVEYEPEADQGIITKILPRANLLKRPLIANVDLLLLVFAHCNPDPNTTLITKLLVIAEASGIPFLVIFNKTDLVGKGKANLLANIYRDYGYQVLCTSVVTHLGKRTLLQSISGKVAVLAGPSGVGKSALLNMLAPGLSLQTGSLSLKTGRGKHTTREVQLLKVNRNTYTADTPGFSQIDLEKINPQELRELFPDFGVYNGDCKFNTCLHLAEPGCAVKEAVASGRLRQERYQIYLELLQEIKENWENRYR